MTYLAFRYSPHFVLLATCVLLCGCGDKSITHYQIPKESDAPAPAFAGEAQTPVTQVGLAWSAPESWQSKPASGMRIASFVAHGSKAEVLDISVVSFPGDGGEDLANVNRWRGQVGLSPLTQDQLASALQAVDSSAGTLQLTDSLGLPSSGKPAQRLLAAWLHQGGKAWFFKMLGDSEAVGQEKQNFITFLKTITVSSAPQTVASTPMPVMTAPADMSTTPVPTAEGASLTWTVQSAWQLKPAVAMRKASYSAGDAEIAISAFPGDVGGALANVNRWRGQVGLTAIDQAQFDKSSTALDVQDLHFVIIEAVGPSSKAIIAALLPWNGSTWFFKLTGTSDAVFKQKADFLKFLNTVKAP